MDLTDPVKVATDALYEALKAKIHEEIEDLKRKARLESKYQKLQDELRCKEILEQSVLKFVTNTFVFDTQAVPISVSDMRKIYLDWRQSLPTLDERCAAPVPTDAINFISKIPEVNRPLYQDEFKGLRLKTVPPTVLTIALPALPLQPADYEVLEPVVQPPVVQPPVKTKGKRKTKTVVVTPAEMQNNYSLLQNMP
jgi:hypothetical protein